MIEQIGVEKLDVHIKYSIIDSKNNEIFSRIETRAVQGNLSIEEEINEIEFKDEEYILRVDILYGNLQRAFAEQKFRIKNGKLEKISRQEPEKEKINLNVLLILLILILAIIIVIILLKRKRKKDRKNHKHKKSWLKRIFVGASTIGGIALLLEMSSRRSIAGFAVNEISKKANPNLLWILLLLLLFGLLFIYRKKILPEYFSNKVFDLIGKEVYTDSGDYIGTIEDVIIEKNKIGSLKIKLDSKKNYKTKGLIIKYSQIKGIKHIIIIKNFEFGKVMG